MPTFYETADATILEECQEFIKENSNSHADYHVFKRALELYVKLSQSLIASHKDFDDVIRRESEKIIKLVEGPEKDQLIFQFNKTQYSLVLDIKAHTVLEALNCIEQRNRRLV